MSGEKAVRLHGHHLLGGGGARHGRPVMVKSAAMALSWRKEQNIPPPPAFGGFFTLGYEVVGEAECCLTRQCRWQRGCGSSTHGACCIYCHNLVFLILIFFLAPLTLVLLELRWSKALDKYKL